MESTVKRYVFKENCAFLRKNPHRIAEGKETVSQRTRQRVPGGGEQMEWPSLKFGRIETILCFLGVKGTRKVGV